MKDGTGINPEPEVISKSVHRRLAVQRPEQDEIKEAIKEINHKWDNFKHGYTSRNPEIDALKAEIESMREFIQLVAEWENAYPEEVFPPIGKDSYYSMCKAAGFSVDRVSAHALRPIIKSYSDMAINFLKEDPK